MADLANERCEKLDVDEIKFQAKRMEIFDERVDDLWLEALTEASDAKQANLLALLKTGQYMQFGAEADQIVRDYCLPDSETVMEKMEDD